MTDYIKDTRQDVDLTTSEGRQKSNDLLVDYFMTLLAILKPTCCMELGAFSAEFSRNVKDKYPDMKVYAFEANPYNYNYFRQQHSFEGINYINLAVADSDGVISFNIQNSINGKAVAPVRGNNSILQKTDPNITYSQVDVESVEISKFILRQGLGNDAIAMWIDVEGAACQVLHGCKDGLNKVDLIFIEVEDIKFWAGQWIESDVRVFLEDQGFTLIGRDGEYAKQYNQIYIKPHALQQVKNINGVGERKRSLTFDSYRDIKGYVINLDRTRWRYDEAYRKLTELGFTNIVRWEATDYKKEDVNTEIRRMGANRLERFVNDAEIALVLSHYRIWANFLAGNNPYCLVFEDDIVAVKDFKRLADFNDVNYGDFDILCFGGAYLDITDTEGNRKHISIEKAKEQQGRGTCLKAVSFWHSHAYLISREGAYKALYGYPAWMSSDKYRQPQVDNYISNYRELKTLLSANRDIPDMYKYNLSDKQHSVYGQLSERLCGILLQEGNYPSTIQSI